MLGRYDPISPVAYGAPVRCPGYTNKEVLSATKGTNADLMTEIASLWITPEDRVADVTFGNGVFWRNLDHIKVLATDLISGIDCRNLPYENESLDVVVFDPPYQPCHGSPSRNFGVGNSYNLRNTQLQTIEEVLLLYREGIKEASRVLASNGRLMIKCQDMTYNHRLHLVHLDVLRLMIEYGIDLADMFVLLNTSRMPQRKVRQQRARRAHSYMLIGVKHADNP